MVTRQLYTGRAQDRESSPAKHRRSTAVTRNQPHLQKRMGARHIKWGTTKMAPHILLLTPPSSCGRRGVQITDYCSYMYVYSLGANSSPCPLRLPGRLYSNLLAPTDPCRDDFDISSRQPTPIVMNIGGTSYNSTSTDVSALLQIY